MTSNARIPLLLKIALSFLLLAYFSFPVAMALAYISMALAFVFGLMNWKEFDIDFNFFKLPLNFSALGIYTLIIFGISYSDAPWVDISLHLTKYGKLMLIPVFFLLLQFLEWRQRFLYAFMLAMGFILISAFANIFWQLPWSKTQNLGWGEDHTVIGDYITQNIMMSFFAILLLEKAIAAQRWWIKLIFGALTLSAIVVVTQLSNGRTGYVLLVVTLGTYALMWARGWKQWLAVAALACVVALSFLTSDKLHQRVEMALTEAQNSEAMEITSIGGRINFWKHTLEMIQEKPITGWGTGTYHSQWCAHVTKEGWCHFGRWHPHNQYLFFWMEHGVLGLLLFIVLVASPILMTRRMAAPERRLAWCFSVLFAVNSLINAPLWSSRESHFFVLMLCLVCAGVSFRSNREKALNS